MMVSKLSPSGPLLPRLDKNSRFNVIQQQEAARQVAAVRFDIMVCGTTVVISSLARTIFLGNVASVLGTCVANVVFFVAYTQERLWVPLARLSHAMLVGWACYLNVIVTQGDCMNVPACATLLKAQHPTNMVHGFFFVGVMQVIPFSVNLALVLVEYLLLLVAFTQGWFARASLLDTQ